MQTGDFIRNNQKKPWHRTKFYFNDNDDFGEADNYFCICDRIYVIKDTHKAKYDMMMTIKIIYIYVLIFVCVYIYKPFKVSFRIST